MAYRSFLKSCFRKLKHRPRTHAGHSRKAPPVQPFRFLDLPPELRNRIYEYAFTGLHDLSPHHLTQVNRQVRVESLQMYHERAFILRIPLQTPAQMLSFLKWIESDPAEPSTIERYAFTYNDIDVGVTSVCFNQGTLPPSTSCELARSHDLGYSEEEIMHLAWRHYLGIRYEYLMEDFGAFMLYPPSSRFVKAVQQDTMWIYHGMWFVGQNQPHFPAISPHATEFFAFFINLMIAMAGKKWDKECLRTIASFSSCAVCGLSWRPKAELSRRIFSESSCFFEAWGYIWQHGTGSILLLFCSAFDFLVTLIPP
jgi:hypothetical protein